MMENKKFLLIYGIIIVVILLFILFVPDSLFNKNSNPSSGEEEQRKIDISEQLNKLNNNKYDYQYLIMYDINGDQSTYKCTGTVNGDSDEGKCSSPLSISYTKENKKEVFKKIKAEYLDISYLLSLIKDIEPEQKDYQGTYLFVYSLNLDNVKTDISIYADKENITEIELANLYGAYVIKLTNIS